MQIFVRSREERTRGTHVTLSEMFPWQQHENARETCLLIVSEGDIMGEIRRRLLHLELGSERRMKTCSLKHCWGREKKPKTRRAVVARDPGFEVQFILLADCSCCFQSAAYSSIGLCLRYLWQLSERRFFFSFFSFPNSWQILSPFSEMLKNRTNFTRRMFLSLEKKNTLIDSVPIWWWLL